MIPLFSARARLAGRVRIAAVLLALMAALALAADRWDRLWSWLPWSDERQLERVTAQRDRLVAEVAAQAAHIEALTAQTRRAEAMQQQVTRLRDLTDPVIHEARSAPDASTPLDPARADRLREHDRRLCELAPGACAEAAAVPDDSGGGGPALPDRDPG